MAVFDSLSSCQKPGHKIVNLGVAGSSPVGRPIYYKSEFQGQVTVSLGWE